MKLLALLTEGQGKIKALLSPSLIDFLKQLERTEAWQIEAAGNRLVIYRYAHQIKAAVLKILSRKHYPSRKHSLPMQTPRSPAVSPPIQVVKNQSSPLLRCDDLLDGRDGYLREIIKFEAFQSRIENRINIGLRNFGRLKLLTMKAL